MDVSRGKPADFQAVADIANALRWGRHLAFIEKALRDREVLVARADNRVAGMLIWDRSFFSRAFIWLLGVAPRAQHRGIASALIREVERTCTGEPLFISTNKSNAPMRALCEKLGFIESGYLEHIDEGDPEIFYFKRL